MTATTETSPLGWVKSTTLEPAWGLPRTTTDVNGSGSIWPTTVWAG